MREKTNRKSSAKPLKASTDPMDVGLLQEMVKLMSQHDLSTVDVRSGDKRVVLKRGVQYAVGPMMGSPSAPPSGHAAPAAAAAPVTPPAAADPNAGLVAIKSPMVGTFYAAPNPGAKAFVAVGSQVSDETDVCVIEAMKVFNNIKAECSGTIAKINVANGASVEFGQVLFYVKP